MFIGRIVFGWLPRYRVLYVLLSGTCHLTSRQGPEQCCILNSGMQSRVCAMQNCPCVPCIHRRRTDTPYVVRHQRHFHPCGHALPQLSSVVRIDWALIALSSSREQTGDALPAKQWSARAFGAAPPPVACPCPSICLGARPPFASWWTLYRTFLRVLRPPSDAELPTCGCGTANLAFLIDGPWAHRF
jgi:hypothetical protein